MVGLGTRIIVAEYAIGIALPLILGLLSFRAGLSDESPVWWQIVLGIWLIGIAANYLPLFIYAVLIARGGTVKEEGQPELVRAKRYGTQQVIILVPFLVVVLALGQEARRER